MKRNSRLFFFTRARVNGGWRLRAGLIVSLALLLTACGQSGPLYHPGEDSPYGPPHYSIFHHPATAAKTDVSDQSVKPPKDDSP
ncbi:MAG: lipoprotein [Gammaproteobacteria bacterium]|nr:lipoprotein [Gammaproteobacteria bacterium]